MSTDIAGVFCVFSIFGIALAAIAVDLVLNHLGRIRVVLEEIRDARKSEHP